MYTYYSCEGLPDNIEEGDSTVAAAVAAISLIFTQCDDIRIWCTFPSSQHCSSNSCKWFGRVLALATLVTSGAMPSFPGILPHARVSITLLSSCADGGISKSPTIARGW